MPYTFSDIIKNKFLEEFAAISIAELLLALLLAFALGLFIVFIYRLTYQGALYSRGFAVGLVLLAMVTALVILTISSNLVLSLGMVGALSIVRFRTAVKEPLDTVFMFWAIAAGIVSGAGYFTVAIAATLLIGLLFVLLSMNGRLFSSRGYLVAVRFSDEAAASQEALQRGLPRSRLRSKDLRDGGCELVLETRLTPEQLRRAEALRELPGVEALSFVSYDGTASL